MVVVVAGDVQKMVFRFSLTQNGQIPQGPSDVPLLANASCSFACGVREQKTSPHRLLSDYSVVLHTAHIFRGYNPAPLLRLNRRWVRSRFSLRRSPHDDATCHAPVAEAGRRAP